jgi:hypothetical protein
MENGWRNIEVRKVKCRMGNDVGRCNRLSLGARLSATYTMYAEQGNRLLDGAAAETENCGRGGRSGVQVLALPRKTRELDDPRGQLCAAAF